MLVEKYRILRQDDASGTGRNSYRITVRQLESMIRLSEAIARANCTSEITPVFVREAYSLLRQSIIHVEQDDIDFDEEELKGERRADQGPQQVDTDAEESQDVEMSAAELSALEESERIFNESMGAAGPSSAAGTSSRAPSMVADAPPAPPPKRKMTISHDKYMTLQSLVVLHLSQVERETGRGVDRDELIDWYLELKEDEIQDVEELEYEKELVTKLLKKLVKVGLPPKRILFQRLTSVLG